MNEQSETRYKCTEKYTRQNFDKRHDHDVIMMTMITTQANIFFGKTEEREKRKEENKTKLEHKNADMKNILILV